MFVSGEETHSSVQPEGTILLEGFNAALYENNHYMPRAFKSKAFKKPRLRLINTILLQSMLYYWVFTRFSKLQREY